MNTADCVVYVGHDHICQRYLTMNFTCISDNKTETADLPSLDEERRSSQNSHRPSRAADCGEDLARRNHPPSEQTHYDLSNRLTPLEGIVATLLTQEDQSLGSLTPSVQFSSRFPSGPDDTTDSTMLNAAGTPTIGVQLLGEVIST